MTKLFISFVLCLLLAIPAMAQQTSVMLIDFEDPVEGVSQFGVGFWDCTAESLKIEWAPHPDSPPGNVGVLKADVDFDKCSSTYIQSNNKFSMKVGEEVANSWSYDVFLPADIPDGMRIYAWVGGVPWNAALSYFETVGDSGSPLVPGEWNTLHYPVAQKIEDGVFTADDSLQIGWQHWPSGPGYTGTIYLDNFTLWFGEPSAIDVETGDVIPAKFSLSHAYPNPFNPVTHVDYSLPRTADVSIIVYDMMGRPVKTLVTERKAAGSYKISWDSTNDAGQVVSSGTYFMKMVTNEFSQSQKFTLLK